MSFRISPPTGSGVASTLGMELPSPRQWDLSIPRIIDTAVNLSGQNIYSALPKDITQAKPIYEQDLTEAQYTKLLAIDKHTTQTQWLLVAEGRVFTILTNVTSAQRFYRNGQAYRAVHMEVTIISEQAL